MMVVKDRRIIYSCQPSVIRDTCIIIIILNVYQMKIYTYIDQLSYSVPHGRKGLVFPASLKMQVNCSKLC